jgi:hypothetical protein
MPVNHLGKTSDEMRRFGRKLITKYGENEPTFEAAAQDILYDIYHEFKDETGEPVFALARTFRLCRYGELPPDIRRKIDPDSAHHWLALVATIGQEKAWNDRCLSEKHAVIAPGDFTSPMLKAAFEQIQLDPSRIDQPVTELETGVVMIQEPISTTRYFLVQDAPGNPNIVEQDDFVKPYNIQSVLGVGCAFDSGSFHLTLFFSKVKLSNTDVQLLMQLSPFISTLLTTYDEKGRYWN